MVCVRRVLISMANQQSSTIGKSFAVAFSAFSEEGSSTPFVSAPLSSCAVARPATSQGSARPSAFPLSSLATSASMTNQKSSAFILAMTPLFLLLPWSATASPRYLAARCSRLLRPSLAKDTQTEVALLADDPALRHKLTWLPDNPSFSSLMSHSLMS